MNKFIATSVAKWYHHTEVFRGVFYFMFGEAFFGFGLSFDRWWLTFGYLVVCLILWFSADYVQRVHHEFYTSRGYRQAGVGSNGCWWPPGNGDKIPRYSDID